MTDQCHSPSNSVLRAYTVLEEVENTGAIYFVEHAITARRKGADEFNDGELDGISCHRAAWADQYAPGPVPKLVMIEHGWWFECTGCGLIVRSEMYDENDDLLDRTPVEVNESVFCCSDCFNRYTIRKTERLLLENEVLNRMKSALLEKFPEVSITTTRIYVAEQDDKLVPNQAIIGFRFPGCVIGDAHFRFDKPEEAPTISVCSGDLPAWETYRSSTNREK